MSVSNTEVLKKLQGLQNMAQEQEEGCLSIEIASHEGPDDAAYCAFVLRPGATQKNLASALGLTADQLVEDDLFDSLQSDTLYVAKLTQPFGHDWEVEISDAIQIDGGTIADSILGLLNAEN